MWWARGLTLAYRTQPGRCTKLNQGFATRIKASPPGGPSAGTVRPFRHDFENAQNDFDFGIGHLIPEDPRSPSVIRDSRRFRYPRSGRSEAADDQAGVRSHLPRRRINAYRLGHCAFGVHGDQGDNVPRVPHHPSRSGARAGFRGRRWSPRSVPVCDPSDGMSSSRPGSRSHRPQHQQHRSHNCEEAAEGQHERL